MVSQAIPILKKKERKKIEDFQIKKVNGLLQREEFPHSQKIPYQNQYNQAAKN